MLIAWRNYTDAAMLSAGSELATLPGTNVQQEHVSRKWHTAAGVKSSYVLFDLGQARALDLLMVLGSNMTNSGTVRVRASTADPTAAAGDLLDTGSLACGIKEGYGAIYKHFASTSARYWRVDLADSAVESNLQTGRIVLFPSWQPSVNEQLGGSNAVKDRSVRSDAWGGQVWIDRRPKQRVKTFALDFMGEAEMYGNAFALAYEAGLARDVLVVPDPDSAYLSEQAVFGLLADLQALQNDRLGYYMTRFSVEERL